MARNLSRNTQVFISTKAPGDISVANCIGDQEGAALGDNNTWKVNVLDGYSFSQDTNTQEISVSESASECTGSGGLARGSLSFNTSLNPVDVSFSTYVRPFDITGTLGGGKPTCVELPLWAGALGTAATLALSPAAAATATFQVATAPDTLTFTTEQSDVNELMTMYLYFKLENTTYVVSNFSIGSAEVDFSIDGIAMINWSGSGTAVAEDPAAHTALGTLVADVDYVDVPTTTSTSFLRNKLSTLVLTDNQGTATTGDLEATATGITAGVITLTVTTDDWSTGVTAADYVGGRVYGGTEAEWATILSIAEEDPGEITVAAADVAKVNAWTVTTTVDVFKPASHAAITYCIPITSGSLTLENNMTYLTPEELAIVNQPLAGFTGNRSITGSVSAYLNTGAQGSGGLLDDLLEKITETSNDYSLTLHMGNAATAAPRVDFVIPHAQVSVPTTNVEDVISTEINFSAKSWDSTEQSFENANEMTIAYVNEL